MSVSIMNGNGVHSDDDSDSDFEMEALMSDEELDSPSESNNDSIGNSDADDEADIALEPLFPFNPDDHVTPTIPLTLRQRRQSKSLSNGLKSLAQLRNKSGSNLKQLEENERMENDYQNGYNGKRCPKFMWKKAMKLMKRRSDPWEEYHIEKYKTHRVVRHRYHALKKMWVKDETYVKMEPAPFNHGAMRECFRLKKMNMKNADWLRAQNYVAKCYIQNVERHIYFEDVVLQMDAKLWGEEYNRHRPPKKVDIFQLSIIEFADSPGSPLYHLEHFIEGEYIKYNSNSGFVEEHMRLTPQAFSHFTFERSGHEMIVIDIQGVGDLYTDPQIHTADGKDYGDGNLGTRGMALFFHSHICNNICQTLKLAPFDLAKTEKEQINTFQKIYDSSTKVRGFEEMCISPSPKERIDLSKFMHMRTISSCSSDKNSGDGDSRMSEDSEDDDFVEPPIMFRSRQRFVSESEGDTWSKEEDRKAFSLASQRNHRSSCFQAELNKIQLRRLSKQFSGEKVDKESESILGQIHLDLAKYHEAGRFSPNGENNDELATMFHLEHAASLGILEAILTVARLHLNLQRDILPNYQATDFSKGLEYMESACDEGSREAAVLLGNAYHHGQFDLEKDWGQAIHFYEKAIELYEDNCVSAIEYPNYTITASIAAMYAEGGNGLDRCAQKAYDLYNEAAEVAQSALKGRLAMKYYTLAEEAGAELED